MEFNLERIAMSAALLAMAGAIVAKMVTMQLIKATRKAIEAMNQTRLEAMRDLGKVRSKKNAADHEQQSLQGKHKKAHTQLNKLKSELSEFKRSETEKQKQRAAVRGKLA